MTGVTSRTRQRACFKNVFRFVTHHARQGLKPAIYWLFSARLKSCPVTNRFFSKTLTIASTAKAQHPSYRIGVARPRSFLFPRLRPAQSGPVLAVVILALDTELSVVLFEAESFIGQVQFITAHFHPTS